MMIHASGYDRLTGEFPLKKKQRAHDYTSIGGVEISLQNVAKKRKFTIMLEFLKAGSNL